MALRVGGPPSGVLAHGSNGAVLVSEHGRLLATVDYPSPPIRRLVVMDFNGDGLNDVILVSELGVFGYAQSLHLGGSTLSTLLCVALGAMGLLLWAHQANQAALYGGAGPGARKLRSTEYTD
jgi:hypothetical protein